jgi:hypothetical protein
VNAGKAARLVLALVALVSTGSCLNLTGNDVANSVIRIANASGQTLTIFIDDHLSIDGSLQGNVSEIVLPSGQHTLGVRTANGVETPLLLTTTPGGLQVAYAYTTSSNLVNLVLLDTTAVPAAGTAKVRAINLSKLIGSVDIYASQPSGATGAQLSTSFDFLTVTPYAQKSSGSWEVYVTAHNTATKVLSTGTFQVESGGRRTLMIIDVGTTPTFRELPM